jgi:hypothetical protein
MAKLIRPDDFGNYLIKRQGKQSEVQFALSVGIARQNIRALKRLKFRPSPDVLARVGLEMVYRPLSMPGTPAKKATKAK